MVTKLKIDVRSGVLEVEGEEAFVKTIYEEYKKDLKQQMSTVQSTKQNHVLPDDVAKTDDTIVRDGLAKYETLGDVFAAIGNAGGLSCDERALVAAAHSQLKGTSQSFGGFEINKELAHVGYRANKIARDLETNMKMTPARIVQLRKNGKSAQARKTYKVTTEGFKAVDKILAGNTQ